MKKKKKVQGEDNLPGYPYYPASEDIVGNEKRADVDVEDLSRSHHQRQDELKKNAASEMDSDQTEIFLDNDSDITADDLYAIGRRDGMPDGGEDETLIPKVSIGPDLMGGDLDVPGSELDDESEDIGSEDEENNYYSRGQE